MFTFDSAMLFFKNNQSNRSKKKKSPSKLFLKKILCQPLLYCLSLVRRIRWQKKKHTVLQITLSAFQSWTLAILKSKILYQKVRNKLLICSVTLFALCLAWKTKYLYTKLLCAVSCKILSAGTDLLTSDSYFSRVTQVNFPVPFFFPKQKW